MARKIIVTNSRHPKSLPNGTVMTVTNEYYKGQVSATVDGGNGFEWFIEADRFKEYTPNKTPTQWRDMTPEQKGALLLAHNEGKVIEVFDSDWLEPLDMTFYDWNAYRIKPSKPKVETVTMYGYLDRGSFHVLSGPCDTHRITLTIRDGKVDPVAQVEEL